MDNSPVLTTIEAGGIADLAGLQAGDLVRTINQAETGPLYGARFKPWILLC
jgi:hypothetical protein